MQVWLPRLGSAQACLHSTDVLCGKFVNSGSACAAQVNTSARLSAGACTMDKVLHYIAFSFKQLEANIWPVSGPFGEDLSNRGRSPPSRSVAASA